MSVSEMTALGGYTPICDDCGVHLCWEIGLYEYLEDKEFWDNWCCKTCKPEYKKLKKIKKSDS